MTNSGGDAQGFDKSSRGSAVRVQGNCVTEDSPCIGKFPGEIRAPTKQPKPWCVCVCACVQCMCVCVYRDACVCVRALYPEATPRFRTLSTSWRDIVHHSAGKLEPARVCHVMSSQTVEAGGLEGAGRQLRRRTLSRWPKPTKAKFSSSTAVVL